MVVKIRLGLFFFFLIGMALNLQDVLGDDERGSFLHSFQS